MRGPIAMPRDTADLRKQTERHVRLIERTLAEGFTPMHDLLSSSRSLLVSASAALTMKRDAAENSLQRIAVALGCRSEMCDHTGGCTLEFLALIEGECDRLRDEVARLGDENAQLREEFSECDRARLDAVLELLLLRPEVP